MSSIKGTRSFKAIGFNNGTEIGPVNVNWSLIGGDVASGSIREGILKELNVNVGKIGVFTTAEGAKSSVENSEQVDFVSYLSSTPTGDIRIQAAYGSLTPVDISIRLKQPKISIKINKLDTIPYNPLIEEWAIVTKDVWDKEYLLNVEFVNISPDIINNEQLLNPPLLPNSNENLLGFYGKTVPDLEHVIINDTEQNKHYNTSLVYTRQLERLLSKNRGDNKVITITITRKLIDTSNPAELFNPILGLAGWTTTSRHTYKRSYQQIKIDDPTEAGISLLNIPYNNPPFDEADSNNMAHEIGHLLIRGSNDHMRENGNPWGEGNLMNQGGSGKQLEPIQWIHALGLNGDISYFIGEE